MGEVLNLLVIEDSHSDFLLIERHLKKGGRLPLCRRVASIEELNTALDEEAWDVVLSDYRIPQVDFVESLELIQARLPDVPVILVSGSIGEEKAVELLKLGIHDFVPKDSLLRLVAAIERSLQEAAERRARRMAEQALRENEERLRLALTAANEGLYDLNIQTGEAQITPEYATMLGYDPAELQETNALWIERLHPHDSERVSGLYQAYIRGEIPVYEVEFRQRTKSGDWKWILSVGKIVAWDAAGRPLRMLGTHTDITDRKRTEQALRVSEEHYRSLFDNMLNGFAYCKMHFEQKRPKDFTYLSVNKAFETLTGLKNVIGKRVSDVIPGIRESDPELFEIYGRVASTGAPERFETYVQALEMWFSISVYSPREEHFVAVFDVITERKKAEQALRDSLEEKVALLKEVHHRVKNNLQIVASLLNLQASRAQNQQTVDLLLDTRSRVHAMALLHEVLYRSGNLARISFAAYVEELCTQLVRAFGASAMRIKIEKCVARIGMPLEQAVPCGLIINELVSNALKHAFPDDRAGKVTIELSRADSQNARLCVRDDGVGMRPGTDPAKGATLGLQLASILAGQLGGQLAVESEDGNGTLFSVIFPLSEDTE